MLRISVRRDPRGPQFKLEGKLAHEWVAEAAQAWTAMWNEDAPRGEIIVDLHEVSFVDDSGRALLCQMHSTGARLKGCGPLIGALIEEINGDSGHSFTDRWAGGIVGLILCALLANLLSSL